MLDVNLVAVLAAALSGVIIGFFWYHPKVFGTVWMGLVDVSPESMEAGKKQMPLMALAAFVAALVMAFISAHALEHFRDSWGLLDAQGAVSLAFLAWAAFIVPALLSAVLWERKPVKLFAINAGYWLVALCVMALVVSLA